MTQHATPKTTTPLSAKQVAYPPLIQTKFDGMLDLISEKNTKIGKLIIELSEAKEHFERLIASTDSQIVKRGIRLRIGQLDRFIKEALA